MCSFRHRRISASPRRTTRRNCPKVMDQSDDPERLKGTPAAHRRYRAWFVAAIAVVAIAIALATGRLSAAVGLPAVAAVIAAAWYVSRRGHVGRVSAQFATPSASSIGDIITDVILALPDPTILLDGDGRVIAMNASASSVMPSLRRGGPVALALRIPDVIDAIRSVALRGEPERVEFAERVPSERWF